MESLVTRYGIPYEPFRTVIKRSHGVVSGSAALAIFLEENEVEAGYQANDIDIWFPLHGNFYPLACLLFSSGYVLLRAVMNTDLYAESLNRILRILTFLHPTHQTTVQLIHVDTPHMVDYIIQQFDLSVCMTWWNADEERCETFMPEMTLAKRILATCIGSVERFQTRLDKYRERGFIVMHDEPSPTKDTDPRSEIHLVSWNDRTAFDVWLYDEIDIRTHLQESSLNILLGCGTAWFAFDRKRLVEYMKQHGGHDYNAGDLYDTPFRHSLSPAACEGILLSRHTIYELVDPMLCSGKTLYSVRAYSLEDWANGCADHIYHHPVAVLESAIEMAPLALAPPAPAPSVSLSLPALPALAPLAPLALAPALPAPPEMDSNLAFYEELRRSLSEYESANAYE